MDHYLVSMCVRRQTGHWLECVDRGLGPESQTRKEAVQAAGTGGRRYRSRIGTRVQPLPVIDQDHNQSGAHWAAWSKNRVNKAPESRRPGSAWSHSRPTENIAPSRSDGPRQEVDQSAAVNLTSVFHNGAYRFPLDLWPTNIIDTSPCARVISSSLEPEIL